MTYAGASWVPLSHSVKAEKTSDGAQVNRWTDNGGKKGMLGEKSWGIVWCRDGNGVRKTSMITGG